MRGSIRAFASVFLLVATGLVLGLPTIAGEKPSFVYRAENVTGTFDPETGEISGVDCTFEDDSVDPPVDVTVTTKGQDFQQRIVIEGEKTPFRLKVPGKPLEVALNDKNQTLAHDVVENQNW